MPPSGRAGRHDSKHGATQSPMKGPAPRRAALHSYQRRADHPPSRPASTIPIRSPVGTQRLGRVSLIDLSRIFCGVKAQCVRQYGRMAGKPSLRRGVTGGQIDCAQTVHSRISCKKQVASYHLVARNVRYSAAARDRSCCSHQPPSLATTPPCTRTTRR
jgi:hypothetical protein